MTKTYNTPKRSHIVKTRLDDEEHADFLRRLEIYDMNQSEFIREAISGATIKPTIVATLVSDDLLAAIGKLTAEYGRIGNNLNQIARHLNEWHSPYPVMANLPESSGQNDHLIAAQKTRERIASETGTSESYVKRADQYAKGVDAAEEVLPGIKNDLLLGKFKPRETDVAAVARASPEERREKAEQLRVIPEKKPKADKESARSGTKRRQEVYATIDKSYEDMKDSKRVTEDSALVSLRYTARNMVETCDVLFTNFPGLLEKPDYKDQVIEIMQEPKQYILKLEGETDNEQHSDTLQADGGQQPGFGDSRCVPAQAEHRACGKDRGRVQ